MDGINDAETETIGRSEEVSAAATTGAVAPPSSIANSLKSQARGKGKRPSALVTIDKPNAFLIINFVAAT